MHLLGFAFNGGFNFTKDVAINCLLLTVSFLFVERSRKPMVAVLFGIAWGMILVFRGFLIWPS